MSNLTNYPISSLLPPWTHDQCVLGAPIYLAIEVKQQNGTDVSLPALASFLRAILPASRIDGASDGILFDWWASNWLTSPNKTNNFVVSIYASCSTEVCQAVDWPGDPDIAGIGVRIQKEWNLAAGC
jgi:hypothetical protein